MITKAVTEWRYLDKLESLTEDVNMYGSPCFEFHGQLDVDLFEKAFIILSIRNPELRAFITESDNRYVLEVRENEYPKVTWMKGGKKTLGQLINDGLTSSANEPPDMRPTSNIIVVANERGGYIILRLRHSICDPYNIGAFLSRLFDIYTDLTYGKDPVVNPGSLPRSPLSIVEKNWGKPRFYFNTPKDIPIETVDGFCLPIDFNREDTDALLAVAKQHESTFGSYLLGEILLAFKKCNPESSNTLKVNTLLSLRNRLDEAVGETDTTYLTGRCIVPIDISIEDNAATLGNKFKERLQNSVDRKEVYIAGYSMDTLGSTLNRMADIRFNSSRMSSRNIRTPKNLDIVGYTILNLPPNRWRLRVIKNSPSLDAISWTINGELKVTLIGHMAICSIVPELEYRLRNIIEFASN